MNKEDEKEAAFLLSEIERVIAIMSMPRVSIRIDTRKLTVLPGRGARLQPRLNKRYKNHPKRNSGKVFFCNPNHWED